MADPNQEDLKPRYCCSQPKVRKDQPRVQWSWLSSYDYGWVHRRCVELRGNIRSSSMIIMDATAFSGFARKTAESVSDFANVVRNLIMDIRDCYRPGLYHMR